MSLMMHELRDILEERLRELQAQYISEDQKESYTGQQSFLQFQSVRITELLHTLEIIQNLYDRDE